MNAVAIDTLKFANRLKAVGFNDEQAKAITDLQRETVTLTLTNMHEICLADELASKRDLKNLEAEMNASDTGLKRNIELLRVEIQRDIAVAKADEMMRWAIAVNLLQAALLIAVLLKVA